MRLKILFALIATCLLFPATFIAAQEMPSFTLFSSTPVISHSRTFEDWDGRYTDPGAALYHDGQFHMFRNGFRAWPASVQIGYLTSADGLTWTEMSEEPVLMSDDVPFTDLAALASSALVMDDGTWVLYFYTWNQGTPASEIGRATAENPLGEWTVDPQPVLTRGGEGSWDANHVNAPSVVRTDDGYAMYYTGGDGDTTHIGMATSRDGIEWTKYDDPATTDAPFAESDPVLMTDRQDFRYHQPRVERTDEGYLMVYRLLPADRVHMGLGIATSADGTNWTIITDEPFWGRSTIPGTNGFWFTATAYHDDTLYLYIEGGRGANTDIYVATAPDSFFEMN